MLATGSEKALAVGIGEMAVGTSAGDLLVAYGLGSCVGVAFWDPTARVGGMAHIMLPDSATSRQAVSPGRFADTAVPALLASVARQGAARSRLVVKLAGGAQILAIGGTDGVLAIGQKNISATREALRRLGLTVAAEDVGGRCGRTVRLYLDTGRVVVQAVGQTPRELGR